MHFIPNDTLRRLKSSDGCSYGTFTRALNAEALSIPAAYHNQRAFIRALRTRLTDQAKTRDFRNPRRSYYLSAWQMLDKCYEAYLVCTC